ncbi:hypothetical protein MLD38_014389 [Melastoma candidum]|uniref:Uncharacterized protein n=1 Tax=Melastoma candidum TaxID=119954 RepID=A0ACB9RBZ7_9MYRT|nr:hypothetical protein MLD38_014389 [Melastoma candidum]
MRSLLRVPGCCDTRQNFSAVHLPDRLAGSRNERTKMRRYIIFPYVDRSYRLWETLLVLIVFTAWALPFEFRFLERPTIGLSILENLMNELFAGHCSDVFRGLSRRD